MVVYVYIYCINIHAISQFLHLQYPYRLEIAWSVKKKKKHEQRDSGLIRFLALDILPSIESFNPHLPQRYSVTAQVYSHWEGRTIAKCKNCQRSWQWLLWNYIKYSNRLPDYETNSNPVIKSLLSISQHRMPQRPYFACLTACTMLMMTATQLEFDLDGEVLCIIL